MHIPDYIIFDDIRRREEAERDGGLQPLHIPLYAPEALERPEYHPHSNDEDDAPKRGVVIIDMDSLVEVTDD